MPFWIGRGRKGGYTLESDFFPNTRKAASPFLPNDKRLTLYNQKSLSKLYASSKLPSKVPRNCLGSPGGKGEGCPPPGWGHHRMGASSDRGITGRHHHGGWGHHRMRASPDGIPGWGHHQRGRGGMGAALDGGITPGWGHHPHCTGSWARMGASPPIPRKGDPEPR